MDLNRPCQLCIAEVFENLYPILNQLCSIPNLELVRVDPSYNPPEFLQNMLVVVVSIIVFRILIGAALGTYHERKT